MNDDGWNAADWVAAFEANGGIVFPSGIATPLTINRENGNLKTKLMCASIKNDERRWLEIMTYANSPERLAYQATLEITVKERHDSDGERLVVQDYLDAMQKYKVQVGTYPPANMCLELIQRDYFGMFDQEMEFSEVSLSVCLRDIADNWTDDDVAKYFLTGLANALVAEKSPWQLKLSRKKWAGKFKSVSNTDSERAQWALEALECYEAEGWPTEAAIAKVAEGLGGLSRASTFKIVKEGRRLKKFFADFPLDIKKSTD